MKKLYFDCFSGISGDMVIGALIDAGADPLLLSEELRKLKIDEEYELTWQKVIKNGISSTKFDVVLKHNVIHDDLKAGHEHESHHGLSSEHHHHNHDHNSEHHHHNHDHNSEHHHDHHHEHHHHENHQHAQSHEHSHHHHNGQRNYKEIVQMIEGAHFSDHVRETALKIFKKIGEAEGFIHGIPLESVHFHEVGATDSIIDIVGTAILIEQLNISGFKSSPIPVGTGNIRIDHGIYPVPAPATLEILKGVPIAQTEIKGELTTPTGAAIVSVLAEEFCSFPSMIVHSVGYGAGTKTFNEHPNVLRIILSE